MMDEVRGKLAKLVNANKLEIIFTSGATESLTLVAHGLESFVNKGDEIIVTFGEHTSNLLP
jgi:cysteine desulfurase/selenocysteine lyase